MDPRRLLPALLTVTVVCLVTTLVTTLGAVALRSDGDRSDGARSPASTTPVPARPSARSAAEILAAWDERRSQAWARGDVRALADLYLPGSGAGAADAGTLRRWTLRGLRVVGLQTQVLELTVITRGQRRLGLLVTDRVVGGEAVRKSGRRVRLPTDRASTRRITLEKRAGRWLVADVRDARPR